MTRNINATKCVRYLRYIGVPVTPELAARWAEVERDSRETKRAQRRELKKSCGHFRTSITRVISDEGGDEAVTVCLDCRKYLARKPWTRKPPRRRKPLPAKAVA